MSLQMELQEWEVCVSVHIRCLCVSADGCVPQHIGPGQRVSPGIVLHLPQSFPNVPLSCVP